MENLSGRTYSAYAMNGYKQIRIDPDSIEYIRERLSQGRTLSRYLLECINLERGAVFTFVPPEIDERSATNYRDGPLLPQPGPECYITEKSDSSSRIQMVPTPDTDLTLAQILREYLRQIPGRLIVLEEGIARPTDPCMKTTKNTRWQAFNDEIYYFLTQREADVPKTIRAIKDAKCVYPGLIGCMVYLSELQSLSINRNNLTANKLKQMANNTERIIIGAYDGEGYLVWQKREGG